MTLSINGHAVIPGAEWVTRGGFSVSIETVDMRADAPAVISGCTPDGKTFWYKDGHAYFGRDDEWDLIRPVAAPAEKKVEKPQPGSWVMCNGRKQYFVGPNDDGLCVLKADFGGFELAHPSTITPAPEKRKVQIAEFWTVHNPDGGRQTGTYSQPFHTLSKGYFSVHHPAREIEVDDV